MKKKIVISVSSGITRKNCFTVHFKGDKQFIEQHTFEYLTNYIHEAITLFKDIKFETPQKRSFKVPYTVYERFVYDFSKYDSKHKKEAINVYFDAMEIGHLSQNDKYYTHQSKLDKSIALEHTNKGTTCYGEDYFITNGMILHRSQFVSTFI